MDVDFCRAVAAAVLGDAARVAFNPLTGQNRFPTLSGGQIEVLSRTTTWTFLRDAQLGLNVAAPNFFDGQGFLVRSNSGVTRADQLAAIRVAVPNPAEHELLPDRISKEPNAAAVRHGDDQWFDIVRWVGFGLIEAEERGVTRANVRQMLADPRPAVRRLLGVSGDLGPTLRLDRRWLYFAIRSGGNYADIYGRHLGVQSPVQLPRGLNDLWTRGGLMLPPPLR